MLSAVRRGHVFASALRTFSSRSNAPQIAIRAVPKWSQLPVRPVSLTPRSLHTTPSRQEPATAARELDYEDQPPVPRPLGKITKFQELADQGLVSSQVIDTITQRMGIETMTEVQTLTVNETLKGIDMVAQAKTGTGKTLAFLIPVLQNILKDPNLERTPRYRRPRSSASDIRALIISPTRELAEQIAVEARKVAQNTGVVVQTAVGGTMKREGLMKIQREGCHILVGTPGRLHDIFSDEYTGVSAPKLSCLVLDEADRLLDQGFAPEIQRIQDLLPPPQEVDRQTLMFSATVPQEVMGLVRETMKPDFKFVQTVKRGEVPTHQKVRQKVVYLRGLQNQMPALFELAQREIERSKTGETGPFKAIVYFASTAEVSLAHEIFRNLRTEGSGMFGAHPLAPTQMVEMHSRLSQAQRTRNSDIFRRASAAILFSSDVTARGMDFPNVTHVIQFGLPRDRDSYVHRIGRTARANKAGEGWLFISDFEHGDLRFLLRGMPITEDESLQTPSVDMTRDAQLSAKAAATLTSIGAATKLVTRSLKAKAFQAGMGIYAAIRDKQMVIDKLNELTRFGWGMSEPPAISHGMAQKLGYSRIRGINIGVPENFDDEDGGGGRFGSRSGRSGGGYGSGGFGGRSGGFGGGDRDRGSFGGSRDRYGSGSSGGSSMDRGRRYDGHGPFAGRSGHPGDRDRGGNRRMGRGRIGSGRSRGGGDEEF